MHPLVATEGGKDGQGKKNAQKNLPIVFWR